VIAVLVFHCAEVSFTTAKLLVPMLKAEKLANEIALPENVSIALALPANELVVYFKVNSEWYKYATY
jgi:hypothetical protein